MRDHSQEQETIFEAEVRRVAGELFPRARAEGPVKLAGRERDAIYADGETIHVVEATVSSKRDKASRDLEKSAELVRLLRKDYQDRNFKIWLVLRGEPTADQNSLVAETRRKAKCPVEVCSYRQFSAKLVDAGKYLELRANHPFGSIRRPEDERDFHVPPEEYIPIDLFDPQERTTTKADSLPDLLSESPQAYLLVGDFGAGKSMTLRHAYFGLRHKFLVGTSSKFPVYLNLADHFGQKSPAEALMRHGEELGFPIPSQLVAAWKAGRCHVFLDGFDELSSTRLVRGVSSLKQARRDAMRLVQAFIQGHPPDSSLFVSGRQHYFDSMEELGAAFGLKTGFSYFTLNEFTTEQVASYLKKKGFRETIPEWLPARPLLLGYLAVQGLLEGNELDLSSLPREVGWDHLVNRICEREARQIDAVSVEPKIVREFVERLATSSRRTVSGRGPIHVNEIRKTFEDVFGLQPDEKAETVIYRMAGFTAASGQEDAREFIDDDYADACRAGDVVRYVVAPHDPRLEILRSASLEMGELGAALAARRLEDASPKRLSAALDEAGTSEAAYLAFDILLVMQQLNADYTGNGVVINDGLFRTFEMSKKPDLRNVSLIGCYFGSVEVVDRDAAGPVFRACDIEEVFGALGIGDVPPALAPSSSGIGRFVDEGKTNADILDLPIPLGVKVLMTILRKLFMQPGRGRKENALYRGLDARARAYVPEILNVVEQMDYARPHRIGGPVVWFPNRSRTRQARHILQSPQQSPEPLAVKVRSL